MTIARTAATAAGSGGLHPDVLAFSTSFHLDRALFKEDLLGSLAHLSMLTKVGLMPAADAKALHQGLVGLWSEDVDTLPQDEEDIHMAVEAELAKRVGEPAGRLHTARSRNDQVALDVHLHVREQCANILDALASFIDELATRAEAERETFFPSYTHRQRAIPISAAYWLAAYGMMFARDAELFTFALNQVDQLPLGVGAIAGSSLPIDREHVRARLGFSRITQNGLDTVGNRDFAMDYTYAVTRLMLHGSRLAADVIDFATAEFGFLTLDGSIACGSSMMPQKKNPDVFELIRGKSTRALGNHVSMLTMVKGLPGGYLRDLQEDRAPLLETGPLARSVLAMLRLSLPKVTFDVEACREALLGDYTQATDLAEALVKKGLAFRKAYQAVGALVTFAKNQGLPLAQVTLEQAQQVNAAFDAKVLECLDPLTSVARKVSAGSTGPQAVAVQIAALREAARTARATAASVPRLATLFQALKETP
ncbi:MAG: argininosuccinate lyase [Archangiaceae bacterium]|nr:argininosuccinate lyase [Archangiaceae bacterium]